MKNSGTKENIKETFMLFALLLIMIPIQVYSQEISHKSTPDSRFAVVVSSDNLNNYISIDLASLPGFFERAYLLDHIFADPKLVVNNSNISGPSLEVFSDKLNNTNGLIKSLEEYRDKAIEAGKSLSDAQKQVLLEKYNKYR
jgi:hypothetical protein